MKVYVLSQASFHEGEFGDLEFSGRVTVGIFSTQELAEEAQSKLKVTGFYAQFGMGESTPKIQEYELDVLLYPEGIDNTNHYREYEQNNTPEPEDEDPYEDTTDTMLVEAQLEESEHYYGEEDEYQGNPEGTMGIGLKTVIVENTWLKRGLYGIDFGWGNGYVVLPKDHKYHGVSYDDIPVDVHGGLTYSGLVTEYTIEQWNLPKEDLGKWVVGFDTAHSGDNLYGWPKDEVQREANRLMAQL